MVWVQAYLFKDFVVAQNSKSTENTAVNIWSIFLMDNKIGIVNGMNSKTEKRVKVKISNSKILEWLTSRIAKWTNA